MKKSVDSPGLSRKVPCMAYNKLFSSILTSTIWNEDDRTRIVWITLLACADKNGEVQASVPGLARIAGVPVEDCRAAIKKFLSPDPDSRTKDDEGRRLQEIDGGWFLLNFPKYRDMASKEDNRIKELQRKARWRAKRDKSSTGQSADYGTVHDVSQVCPSPSLSPSLSPCTPSSIPSSTPHAEADMGRDSHALVGGIEMAPPKEWPKLETVLQFAATNGILQDCAERWWLGCDARGGCDNNGVGIVNWASSLLGYWVGWRAKIQSQKPPTALQTPQTKGDPFWKAKTQLDLVSSEIKAIEDRSGRDVMGNLMVSEKDRPNLMQLKKQRAELKKTLGLTQ